MRQNHTRLLSLALIASVALMAGGCESPPTIKNEATGIDQTLQSFRTSPCCIALDGIRAEATRGIKEPQEVWLGSARQRVATPAGSGYYFAVKVPEEQDTFHFEVESFSTPVGSDRHIAIPIIFVLNEDFSVSRSSSVEMTQYWRAHPMGLWGERERLKVFVRVDRKVRPRERYVLITTPERSIGQLVSFSSEIGGGVSVIPLGTTTAVVPRAVQRIGASLLSSPEGEIRITNRSSPMTRPFDRLILF